MFEDIHPASYKNLILSWINPYLFDVDLWIADRVNIGERFRITNKSHRASLPLAGCDFRTKPIKIGLSDLISYNDFSSVLDATRNRYAFEDFIRQCEENAHIENYVPSRSSRLERPEDVEIEKYIAELCLSSDPLKHLQFLVLHEVAHCILRIGNDEPDCEITCDLWALRKMYSS